jgi:hypothetical protein
MYYLEAILQVFVYVRPSNRSELLYRSQTTLQHKYFYRTFDFVFQTWTSWSQMTEKGLKIKKAGKIKTYL